MSVFRTIFTAVGRSPSLKQAALKALLRVYPPYLGADVRVTRVSRDLRHIEVEMPLRPWNRNYVGTQFGGSLYSMCDPFFMLILMENLGPDYVVWDKGAEIRFLRPGRGRVRATFELSQEEIARVREIADREDKVEPTYIAEVRDDRGQLVAQVKKRLFVRRRG